MPPLITTYTGKHFDITNMDPAAIGIEDIAHALSLICRGNGHVRTFIPSASIVCSAPMKRKPAADQRVSSWQRSYTTVPNATCLTYRGP